MTSTFRFRSFLFILISPFVIQLTLITSASAEPSQCELEHVAACVNGVDSQFHVDATRKQNEESPRSERLGEGSWNKQRFSPKEKVSGIRANYIETVVTVGCAGNTPANNDAVCGAALDGCPEPAAVQFWQWTRTIDGATGQPLTPFQRTFNPPYVCLAPAEAQSAGAVVDPIAAIVAIVERDFRSLVVLKGATKVTPSPETLVNLPTRFTTDAPETYEIPVTVLGRGVRITAKAQEYQWSLG